MKSRISPNSAKPSAFGAEGSAGLPKLPFSKLGSQSNTNFESSKSTVFRIGTNQTHPKRIRIERYLASFRKIFECAQ